MGRWDEYLGRGQFAPPRRLSDDQRNQLHELRFESCEGVVGCPTDRHAHHPDCPESELYEGDPDA